MRSNPLYACSLAVSLAGCSPSYLDPPADHPELRDQVADLMHEVAQRSPPDRTFGAVIALDGMIAVETLSGPGTAGGTLLPMASASKLFAGLLAATLVDEGVVDLDAPVGDTVPGLPPSAAALSPRLLLTHQDGLAEPFDAPAWSALTDDERRDLPRLEYVRIAASLEPHFSPGKGARYGQTGLVLFALYLETLLDQPMRDILAERVLEPAGMTATQPWTRLDPIEGFDGTVAIPRPGGAKIITLDYGHYDDLTGGMVTTVADLGALFTAIQRRELLSDEAWDLLVTEAPGTGWALAVHPIVADGAPGVGHEGGQSVVVYLSKDRTAASAFLGNVGGRRHRRAGYEIAEKAAQGSRLPLPEPRACPEAPAVVVRVTDRLGAPIPEARVRWVVAGSTDLAACAIQDPTTFACAPGETGLLDVFADAPGYPLAAVEGVEVPWDPMCDGPNTARVEVVLANRRG